MDNITENIILKKIAAGFLTLLMVTLLSFLLMRLSPVDPATAYASRNSAIVTAEQIEAAREWLGLDKPLMVQYANWVKDALALDFGISLGSGQSVFDELAKAAPVTLSVVSLASIIMVFGVLSVGCLCYFTRGKISGMVLSVICVMAISIPAFYLAVLAIDVFAIKFGVLSVAGNTGIMRYLPAACCLSAAGVGFYSQLLAGNIQREMNEDYAIYARCCGLSDLHILISHSLPRAVINLIPNFAQMIGLCLAGAAVVERVFSLPGIGYLIIDSVIKRDSPVIHASILFLAASLVVLDISAALLQLLLKRRRWSLEWIGGGLA